MYEWQVREQLVVVLERAAAGDVDQAAAAAVLAQLRSIWVREKRWRNTGPPRPSIVHIAGVVINCRQARPSCPGYIVDRRQTCQRCGAQLVRGRWAIFFDEGDEVAALGTILYAATGDPREIPCTAATV